MKPAIRISIGIVAMSTSLLLVADSLLEIFPDPGASMLEERKNISESLAVQYSSLIAANRLPRMKPAMDALVAQMPEVLSLTLTLVIPSRALSLVSTVVSEAPCAIVRQKLPVAPRRLKPAPARPGAV